MSPAVRISALAAALLMATGFTLAGQPVYEKPAELSWQGRPLVQVRGKSELPDYIRSYLQTEVRGQFRVADIGERIRRTDVIIGDAEPDRRLLGAAHSGEDWVVAIEHGSSLGHTSVKVYLFESGRLAGMVDLAAFGHWRPDWTHDFARLVPILDRPIPAAAMSGISGGMSRVEVEARLGRPDEVVASLTPGISAELKYPGLRIVLDDQTRVFMMTGTSAAHCLAEEVCPGISADAVRQALGPPMVNTAPAPTRYLLLSGCSADLGIFYEKLYTVEVQCPIHMESMLPAQQDSSRRVLPTYRPTDAF